MSWDFGGDANGSAGSDWDSAPWARVSPIWRRLVRRGGTRPSRRPHPHPRRGAGSSSASLPRVVLFAAGVLALFAIGLFFVTDSTGAAIAGWLVGGPVAIGLVALHTGMDLKRRADPWYAESGIDNALRRGTIVLTLLAVVLNAYTVADHLARM